jgi:hypothetical protein
MSLRAAEALNSSHFELAGEYLKLGFDLIRNLGSAADEF